MTLEMASPTHQQRLKVWHGAGQFPLWRAIRVGIGGALATREAAYHSLAWGFGMGAVNVLMAQPVTRPAVFISSLLISFSIGYLSSITWRWQVVPKSASVAARVVANALVSFVFGYLIVYGCLLLGALLTYWTLPPPRVLQVFAMISITGFIFPVIGFYRIMGEEEARTQRRLERDARRLRRLAEEARLLALRAQINPHFFFNALNTVAALIPTRPDRAERAVELLAQALRPALMRDQPMLASIETELATARAYAELEGLRAGDRLEVSFDIEPAALLRRVPSLFIQPLIENAIRHGAEGSVDPVRIVVTAQVEAGTLVLTVRNSRRDADWARAMAQATPAPQPTGHALSNLASRLRSLFGPDASLAVWVGDAAAEATVRVPDATANAHLIERANAVAAGSVAPATNPVPRTA